MSETPSLHGVASISFFVVVRPSFALLCFALALLSPLAFFYGYCYGRLLLPRIVCGIWAVGSFLRAFPGCHLTCVCRSLYGLLHVFFRSFSKRGPLPTFCCCEAVWVLIFTRLRERIHTTPCFDLAVSLFSRLHTSSIVLFYCFYYRSMSLCVCLYEMWVDAVSLKRVVCRSCCCHHCCVWFFGLEGGAAAHQDKFVNGM